MPRYCLRGQVRPDQVAEYRRVHIEVWPEMLATLRDAGWRNYSLFVADDGLLVGHVETDGDDDLETLRDVVRQQRETTIDDPSIPAYDLTFHTTIGHASGNRLLGAFIGAVHGSTRPAQYLHVTAEVGRETVKQHMTILAAIEDQDPRAASEAMAEHLDYVLRYSVDEDDQDAQADAAS